MQHATILEPIIKRLEDWPIFKLSQDRRRFIQEIDTFTVERLEKQHKNLHELIAQVIYQERIRIKETPWKVDPPNERQFWGKIRSDLVKTETLPPAQAREKQRALLHRIVHRYSEEIVGTFNIRVFRFARWFLTKLFSRLLNAATEKWWKFLSRKNRLHDRIKVFGDLETIRNLFQHGTVIVTPTHFSNLDSILVGYAMDWIVGLPSFSYGAGLNLYNSGAPAFFMNRLGAYRVDRRKKNDIYLETLKSMSNLSIQRGTNSLFFPGGTRSRSGAVETRLKLGLLGTAVEAQRAMCEKGENKKVFIVPLIISYHFVLEAPLLIEQQLKISGKERYLANTSRDRSLTEWLKFVWAFFSQKSEIVLSFGKPMDVVGNFVDAEGTSFDARDTPLSINDYFTKNDNINQDLQREAEYTRILSEKIVDRFHRDNIVLSSHVVAFTAFNMLKTLNEKLDLFALLRQPTDDYVFPRAQFLAAIEGVQQALLELEAKGRLKLSKQILGSPEKLMINGVRSLGIYHIHKPLMFNKKGDLESDDFSVLYFYHNRLDNFGLQKRVKWEKYLAEIRPETELLEA